MGTDIVPFFGICQFIEDPRNRNLDRFPEDFAFRLTAEECESLRSQIVILKKGRGEHRKFAPMAFTEQGVAMLSGELKSKRAAELFRIVFERLDVLEINTPLLPQKRRRIGI